VAQAASTDALNGSAVDLLTSEGPVFAYLTIGSATGSSLDVDVRLQQSANGTNGWADISGATFTQSYNETTADNVSEWIQTAYGRTQRYVRAVAGVTGTVTSVPIAVSIFSMKKVLGGSGTVTS